MSDPRAAPPAIERMVRAAGSGVLTLDLSGAVRDAGGADQPRLDGVQVVVRASAVPSSSTRARLLLFLSFFLSVFFVAV